MATTRRDPEALHILMKHAAPASLSCSIDLRLKWHKHQNCDIIASYSEAFSTFGLYDRKDNVIA